MAQFVDADLATTPVTVTSSPAYLTGFVFSEISGSAQTVNLSNGSGDGDIILQGVNVGGDGTTAVMFGEGVTSLSFPSGIYASASAGGVNVTITYM